MEISHHIDIFDRILFSTEAMGEKKLEGDIRPVKFDQFYIRQKMVEYNIFDCRYF